MEPLLNTEQRKQISVPELARFIFRLIKEEKVNVRDLANLHEQLCPENKQGREDDKSFWLKFYESIARLKQRGLLMDVRARFPNELNVCLTSVGQKSDFHDGILILIDDAQEIVNAVKKKAPNLDHNVEKYYLESLRACQGGHHLSSVISLGAASERAIHCLAEAVVKHDANLQNAIDNKKGNISILTRWLGDNVNQIFKSISEPTFRSELRDKLEGVARIYRLNRNEAGHPSSLPQDWQRDEQECFLNQFRRYVYTIFRAIDILENAEQRKDAE